MGYIRHHAIIITGFDTDTLRELRLKCCELINKSFEKEDYFENDVADSMVTDVLEARTNGYCTFAIFPDGSKEGWSTSGCGDMARDAIIEYIEENKTLYVDYAEFFYGDDEGESKITRHN